MSDDRPNNNPANDKKQLPKDFRPMTSAVLRLEVPKRDGYHRHWFRGDPNRIARARQAGYSHVLKEDVSPNNFDLGGRPDESGSTDMGTLVSVVSGDDLDASGQPGRMYLMECPNEWYQHSVDALAERNESVAEALRGGKIALGENGENPTDAKQRYVSGVIPDLFNPNKRVRRT